MDTKKRDQPTDPAAYLNSQLPTTPEHAGTDEACPVGTKPLWGGLPSGDRSPPEGATIGTLSSLALEAEQAPGMIMCSNILEPPTDWRPFDPSEEYGPGRYVAESYDGTVLLLEGPAHSGSRVVSTTMAGWAVVGPTWQIFGPITHPEWGES